MFSSDEEDDCILESEEFMMTNLSEDVKLISSPTIKATFQTVNTVPRASSASIHYSDDSDDNEISIYTAPTMSSEKIGLHNTNKRPYYVWLLCSFSAIGGFLFGYDTGVISGAMLLLRNEFSLSSVWQEIVVSVTVGAAFIASLCGGFLNDKLGRRFIIMLASFVFTAGAVVLGAAQNVTMLVIGRFILGIGIGFSSMTVPVYIAESAPTNLRGNLVTINNLFITGGQFVASLMDGAFMYIKPDGWRYMLGLASIPSAILFCGFLFLPESPRWLVKKGRESEARVILMKLRGVQAVDEELYEIKESINTDNINQGVNTFVRILQTPPVRRAVMVGCGLQLLQQFSGINTVMYYSATVIKMSGIGDRSTAVWLAAFTAGVNFSFTFVGVLLVEKLGRKKLIMGSLLGVTASLIVLGIAFQLITFNSPAIYIFDVDHMNSSCSPYRNCESCIENNKCGFCYMAGSVNGSCLTADPMDYTHAEYGSCQNLSSSNVGFSWSYGYCPTSYSWVAVLGLMLYLMFFAPGMGPMPWTINSEIYPMWARSTGNSLATATNWLSNLIVSMTFLTLTETITKYGTYWLFSGVAVLGLVFLGVCLPETKGRKLEEMDDLFSQPLSSCWSRKDNRNYTSLGSETTS